MITIPLLFIPTFHGDVRLERIDDKQTRVIVAKATPLEQKALRELAEYATKKKWLEKTSDAVLDEGSFILKVGLNQVQKRIAKALKPGREVVTVVKFADGKMEEIIEAETARPAAVGGVGSSVAAAARSEGDAEEHKTSQAAAAVSKPYRGCPAPAFAQAELRANRVLEAFLSPEQKADFREHNRFVTIGAATGHRYMVTSRHANDSLATFQRSFFDIDDDTPLCVHDWDVPAAEEMLALHLLASLPHHEMYLRRLEDEAV